MTTAQLYKGATLVDLITVCRQMPQDEREQIQAFSGEQYDADQVAASYHLFDGPKWTLCADDRPLLVAGFTELRPGVWQDWMFSTPSAWDPHWWTTTKQSRRVMDAMLRTVAHRLQCVSLASRIQAHKWYSALKLEREGVLRGYGANGEDAIMFSRLRDSNDG